MSYLGYVLCSCNPGFDNFTIRNDQSIWNTTISLKTKRKKKNNKKVKKTHKLAFVQDNQISNCSICIRTDQNNVRDSLRISPQ